MAEKLSRKAADPFGAPAVVEDAEGMGLKAGVVAFIRYIKEHIPVLVFCMVLSVVACAATMAGPGFLERITDGIAEGLTGQMDLDAVVRLAAILAGIYILSLAVTSVQNFIMVDVVQRITLAMRNDIAAKVDRLPLSYFDRHQKGDTLSVLTNDVDLVGRTLRQTLTTLFYNVLLLVVAGVLMFVTNAVMAVVGIVAAALGAMLSAVIIVRSQSYFVQQQEQLGEIDGHIEEVFSGLQTIKAYNAEKGMGQHFDRLNGQLYVSSWKSQFLSGLMPPLMGFTGNLAYVAVCIAGAILAVNGQITIGVIVAFMLYIRSFTSPITIISLAVQSLQSMAAACLRLFEFLDAPEMAPEEDAAHQPTAAGSQTAVAASQSADAQLVKLDPGRVRGDVSFEHVKFGYTPGRTIIKDFSVEVAAGQKVAIVGPTGAGKTTIVNLLMRFYELDAGRITVDGVSIAQMRKQDLRELFGMVLQDTWTFEGSLRENLVFGHTGVPDSRLDEVCAAVGIDDLVARLPEGYDTHLDEDLSLSAGQKQLLTIARAILKDAPLLILDEATSSVDTRTEIKVQQAMDLLTQGRTSFVIAHRLSTIRDADLILVMRDGDIVEKGSHGELLAQGGFYAGLYNSQFSGDGADSVDSALALQEAQQNAQQQAQQQARPQEVH